MDEIYNKLKNGELLSENEIKHKEDNLWKKLYQSKKLRI